MYTPRTIILYEQLESELKPLQLLIDELKRDFALTLPDPYQHSLYERMKALSIALDDVEDEMRKVSRAGVIYS